MPSHRERDGRLSLNEDAQVIIAGAGIAGLTLSLSLARLGLRSVVLEARAEPTADGAGIQLGPNATVVLERIGVLRAVEESATQPDAVIARALGNSKFIARLPLPSRGRNLAAAPYLVVHRAALHNALRSAAEANDKIEFHYDWRLNEIEQGAEQVVVRSDGGRVISGHALVGCDGLWSKVRQSIAPDFELNYSGLVAARTVVPAASAPGSLQDPNVGVWLGPDAHIVKYPIDGGRGIALVVVTSHAQRLVGWGHDLDRDELLQRLPPLSADVTALLQSACDWRQWALYDPEPLKTWSQGRAVVIGDAAHPILPFLAQGGAMAIEDACCLADCLKYQDPERAFAAFERQRRDRVTRVQITSRKNGQVYHLAGIAGAARDAAMRVLPPTQLMRRYDWIYSWQPPR